MIANLRGSELLPADFNKLARCGISRELAEAALLRRVESVEGADIVGRKVKGDHSGIVFPYIWPGEEFVRDYRLRRDRPDLDIHQKETGKYLSPPQRGNLAYLVPGTDPHWLEDVTIPAFLTEGEKKTLAIAGLAQHGLSEAAEPRSWLSIGLSGVWNFRGTVGKTTGPDGDRRDVKGIIPDLERIAWRGRKVTVLFDRNVESNDSVRAARSLLTRELQGRGADVFWFHWPEDTPPGVNGIDDLVGTLGANAVLDLLPRQTQPAKQPGSENDLPQNLDAEREILGSILLDAGTLDAVSPTLQPGDFSLEKHRQIFNRMLGLRARGERVNKITVANELGGSGGIGYLCDTTSGETSIDSCVRIVAEKATLRRAILAAEDLKRRCLLADGNSVEILADAEALLSKIGEKRQLHGQWLSPAEIIEGYPGGLNGFFAPSQSGLGVNTPWPRLTNQLCGFQKGDVVFVAGRPSMGKSIVGMQIAHQAAKDGHGAAFFSLEMGKDSLMRRLISAVGQVDHQRLREGRLDTEERRRAARAASDIWNLPLWIDDTRARTVPAMVSALRKLIAKQPIRVLVIDHLQLMNSIGRAENRHQEISGISHALKNLAGDFNITLVILSQLNRDCEREKRQPRLSDLAESGSLEQDTDVVLFVHRPEQYQRDKPELRGLAQIIVGKQRNGPTGKHSMRFQAEYQRFVEGTTQTEEDE